MVVPAVGVVVGDHDGGVSPELGVLDRVDGVDQEVLFVGGVGVARVPVLVGGGLQEADRRHAAAAQVLEEPVQVVLVFGPPIVPDLGDAGRGQVERVGGGGVVLERLVVRDVVGDGLAAGIGVVAPADGRPVGA